MEWHAEYRGMCIIQVFYVPCIRRVVTYRTCMQVKSDAILESMYMPIFVCMHWYAKYFPKRQAVGMVACHTRHSLSTLIALSFFACYTTILAKSWCTFHLPHLPMVTLLNELHSFYSYIPHRLESLGWYLQHRELLRMWSRIHSKS